MTHPMVGQIHLEDHDGNHVATVTYTQHPMLRAPQLAFRGIWYEQNYRKLNGEWTYRAVGKVPGTIGTDTHLKDVDG